MLDVRLDARPHVGVQARRERPLVLAELRQHVGGDRDREARIEVMDDGLDLALVRRIRIRVDERDGQRLHARVDEVADDPFDLIALDGLDDLALCAHPLLRLARVLERGRRIGLDHDDPSGQRARRLRAGEVEDLLEAVRRDQTHARALRLEHRVRRDRRPVLDELDLPGRDARLLADPLDADENPLRWVCRCRRGLHPVHRSALVLHEEQVGERSPDVDSEPVRHPFLLSQPATGAKTPAR